MPVMIDCLFSAALLCRYTTRKAIVDHLVDTFLEQKQTLDASRVREAVENEFPEQILQLEPTTDLEAYFLLRY